MTTTSRRPGIVRIAALLTASALALGACGQAENLDADDAPTGAQSTDDATTGSNGGEGVETTIRFSWWGSDVRHQLNQQLIEAFEAEYPHIDVVPDFIDWSGYWDKLSTQVAGGNPPDVILMDMNYIREYADRGVLADLNQHAQIETADIDPALIGAGDFDGGLWGLPTGGNVLTIVADPQVFDDAGVAMPDDSTWTWDDFSETLAEIAANTPDETVGAHDQLIGDASLMIWLRQHGEELWGADGGVVADQELLAQLFHRKLQMIESGAYPNQSRSIEIEAAGIEQHPISTHRGAVGSLWSNQLGAVTTASGRDLQLLRYPGETEFERTGLYLKSSMLLSMAAETDHPEEAALFLNWMQNSIEAGEIILADRGLPSNLVVREHIAEMLSPADQQTAEFLTEVGPTIIDSPPPPPVGAAQVLDVLGELSEQVGFGQITPEDAAERFLQEANAILG